MSNLALRESSSPELTTDALIYLPPPRLEPTRNQPRTEFDEGAIEELALNIAALRARGQGIGGTGYLQPVSLRLPLGAVDENGQIKPDVSRRYPITMGETRWRAGMKLVEGFVSYRDDERGTHLHIPDLLIPATISDISEADAYELALYENLHRTNLAPLDEARAIRALMNKRAWSIRRAATEIFGDIRKSGYIVNRLDLLKAGDDVQELVSERPDTLVTAQRIERVKEPRVRAELIQMAKAGEPFSKINARIQATRGLGSTPRKRRAKTETKILPKVDLELALGSLVTQATHARENMTGVDISSHLKPKLKAHFVALQTEVAAMSELL